MGLRAGDLLVSVNDRPVRADTVALHLVGTAVEHLGVLRRRGRNLVRTNLVAAATEPFGLRTVQAAGAGVPITHVASGSPAQRAGLRPGDRLLRIDGDEVTSAAASRLLAGAARSRSGDPVLIAFERDGVERGVLLAPSSAAASASP